MFQFLGQITLFAPNFAPQDWLPCDGRMLPIHQYTALFQIIGTTYGGDGRTSFQLPKIPNQGDALYLICVAPSPYPVQQFVGQIDLYAGSTAPSGWLPCDGRTLPIRDNQMLYSIVGNTFGGDGKINFALPSIPSLNRAPYIISTTGLYPPRP